jgi:hypothetical protein
MIFVSVGYYDLPTSFFQLELWSVLCSSIKGCYYGLTYDLSKVLWDKLCSLLFAITITCYFFRLLLIMLLYTLMMIVVLYPCIVFCCS